MKSYVLNNASRAGQGLVIKQVRDFDEVFFSLIELLNVSLNQESIVEELLEITAMLLVHLRKEKGWVRYWVEKFE